MIYKLIGISTGLGTMAFLYAVVLFNTGSTAERQNTDAVAISAAAIAVGLLTMIWHLNVRQDSETVRKEWRTYLTFLGPLAAAAYLFRVAPNDNRRTTGDSLSRLSRPLLAVSLAILGSILTLVAASNLLPPVSLPFHQAAFNYLLRLGGAVSVAGIGAALGLHYWRSILWILIPSFVALYARRAGSPEGGFAMLGAALLLTWTVATVARYLVHSSESPIRR